MISERTVARDVLLALFHRLDSTRWNVDCMECTSLFNIVQRFACQGLQFSTNWKQTLKKKVLIIS